MKESIKITSFQGQDLASQGCRPVRLTPLVILAKYP